MTDNIYRKYASINSRGSGGTQTQVFRLPVGTGNTNGDWVRIDVPTVSKLLRLRTPTGTPSTTLSFQVRTPGDASTQAPVLAAGDSSSVLSLTVNGAGVFGAAVLAPLSSLVDDLELRVVLGTAPASAIDILLEVA